MNSERSMLFNNGWEFALLENGAGIEKAASCTDYNAVEIPHDWLIYDTNNLYRSGEGWYRKIFTLEKGNYEYSIDFDGVYTDSTVYVNGKKAGDWHYGYSSFSFDITDLLADGENTVMVQVKYVSPNSRWYSGAGIYRNVYFTKTNPVHIVRNGVYISADGESGRIEAEACVKGSYDGIYHEVYDNSGCKVGEFHSDSFSVPDFKLWSLDSPCLYTLKTNVVKDNAVIDSVKNTFGFRSIKFDPNNGFFLNGERMKLKGVCLHHDLGALGAAVNYSATERQVLLMKKMGANAIRTSHNMPSRELLEICDRVGMFVDSESFDMWELPKTEFDNARFFKETAHDDVKSWVEGDRNHPCVIMWSIGNEIYDTHASEHGYEIAEMLAKYVREFDPKCHAALTIASNYIEWENAQKIGKMLVQSGYNYTERCYDEHHKKYPDTVIYGSETSSAVRSRGIYHFPADVPLLTHDDHQCSSLANSCVAWGKPMENAWIDDRDRDFCAGQFVWTGIDYIGEPTPYSTKNSYFGMMDTACFPKDAYYFYQSVWTDCKDAPMIHLLPYWDFNEGQPIDVIAYTNAPAAELFLNGKSLGIQRIDHVHGDILHGHWVVPYEKGELTVNALDESGKIIASDTAHSFGEPESVSLKADRKVINADQNEICFIEISVTDKDNIAVENARNAVKVRVSGAGRLLGLDNGDSTDYDQYKTDARRLFSGKLLAMVGSNGETGEIRVEVSSDGLKPAEIVLDSVGFTDKNAGRRLVPQITSSDVNVTPVRKIEAVALGGNTLNEERRSAEVEYKLLPPNASFKDIKFKLVQPNSVETGIAEAELCEDKIKVTAKGDGSCILRIYAYNGSEFPQVISDTAFEITGLGEAERNPYKMVWASSFAFSSAPVNTMENGILGGFFSRTSVSFKLLDFGKVGSDRITLHIGNSCKREIPVEIWDGVPDEGGVLIETVMPSDNNGWDRAYPCEFTLPKRLKGMHTLSFVFRDNCMFGGFEFAEENRAYAQLSPADCDNVYGDDYVMNENSVENIGNNVVIEFKNMDFAEGASSIEITGRTPNEVNTIQLRYSVNGVSKTHLIEFPQSSDYTARSFDIPTINGNADISFVFMPGSRFDFRDFRFIK
ncbi:MAG: DUF4982 domain-containing protein [Oscillospiraceae bacterium]|nr:DUF4982 domain-containing protein [Oscillospiraceae bacterium]